MNPGFVGSSGKVLGVTFKAKSQGNAALTFANGSVLANDGQGTSILNGLGGANFTISPPAPTPTPTPKEEIQENLKISKLTSTTHQDQDTWYTNNTPKFTWVNPEGTTGISYAIDKNSNGEPGNKPDPVTTSYEGKNIDDGIWYFHIKARNSKGWGPTAHIRFQVDRGKPDFLSVQLDERKDLTDPKIKIKLEATDKVGGIDFYEITLGNQKPITWKDDGSHSYQSPALPPGEHVVLIKAVDKAGNYIVDYSKVTIEPLKTPVLSTASKSLKFGEETALEGKTEYPDAKVIVYAQIPDGEIKEFTGTTDKDGAFSVTVKDLNTSGKVKAWVEVIDARGAKSNASEKVTLDFAQLEGYGYLVTKKNVGIGGGVLALILFTVIAAIVFIRKKRKQKDQILEPENDTDHFLAHLREYVKDEIELLEKAKEERELTPEEKKILFKLKKEKGSIDNFKQVEELIDKE